ncbi:MAG: dihydropteroate synthase [Leptolyngbyaceae cyanobacterium SL_7_1]|nr:dihydropteroate synthase [Leptolyngbyaceae cyanobacterium SL_7_1]
MTTNELAIVPSAWTLRHQSFLWGQRTYLMGILNVTPDSFSDGGQFATVTNALQQAEYLVDSGADLLDIGGQSTRPQADTISLQEELNRVIPVIQAIRHNHGKTATVPISVDTTRSKVAQAAIAAGADLVNDVSAGTDDPAMLPTVAELQVPIVLMHRRGTSKTMQQLTDYDNLIGEIYQFLQAQRQQAIACGISPAQIALDPGIGFAKTGGQNLEILRRLGEFRSLGCPLLVGSSRKSFLGKLLDQPDPQQRVWGTAATCCAAIAAQADILRVHDVKEMRDVCRVADAIWRSP